MRKNAAAVFVLAVLASAAASDRPAPVPKPRLAVIIAVDGLSWERLQTWRPWLTSGLKRLLDEGAVATSCRYEHLNTETAPGHASLASGALPRVHGIPLNEWYAPTPDGKSMVKIYSASQPLPGAPENSTMTIPGPGRLRVETLGDALVARDPRAKVVAISNKDRAAIFLAGRDRHHAVYWYTQDGTYVTSAAYDPASAVGAAAGKVVARFNADRGGPKLAKHLGTMWTRLPEPDPPPLAGFQSGLGAYQNQIVGAEFPHDLTKATKPFPTAFLWTPFADRLLAELAIELLTDEDLGLGRDDAPDLLEVSFSATDYLSHYYGSESVENLETLRSLDLQLGRLLDALTSRVGKENVVVALSADHGFLPIPEGTHPRDAEQKRLRVSDARIMGELNEAVDRELKRPAGATPLVYKYEGTSLWLDDTALALKGAPARGRVLEIVRRELATTWKHVVLQTLVVDDPFPRRAGDEIAAMAWNSRVPGRSGDLIVVPRYGVLVDPYDGLGSSHVSPWEYDTHVPMIFWGGGIAPRTISDRTAPYDLAPTLASRLAVTLSSAAGKPLGLWK